jgi:nucleotide-binding universal stress UspA family protein
VLVGTPRLEASSVTLWPTLDVIQHLDRCGVAARRIDLEGDEADAGSAILDAADSERADLLVMGAYGRSWFREWVLGGATRAVLQRATLPVLMVH